MDRETQIGDVAEIMVDYVTNKKTFLTDKTMTVPSAAIPIPINGRRRWS